MNKLRHHATREVEQEVPKKYERKNRFNGESVMLTETEAMIHDRIFRYELQATIEDQDLGTGASKYWKKMRKDIDWFIKYNPQAYMVLLD
tara:strand:+ start:215 stop:484 length:270 start_codon:yes stop_codon:yes gene_type:complete